MPTVQFSLATVMGRFYSVYHNNGMPRCLVLLHQPLLHISASIHLVRHWSNISFDEKGRYNCTLMGSTCYSVCHYLEILSPQTRLCSTINKNGRSPCLLYSPVYICLLPSLTFLTRFFFSLSIWPIHLSIFNSILCFFNQFNW